MEIFPSTNANQLQGNINVRSGGTIHGSTTNATGTLTLSNERAQPGSDITLNNVNSFWKYIYKNLLGR